jgi:hypothetical protein
VKDGVRDGLRGYEPQFAEEHRGVEVRRVERPEALA